MERRYFIKQSMLKVSAMGILPGFFYKKKINKKGLGIALVGLGSYSTYQLAPALQETSRCYLAGIVTGTPEKEGIWAKKYQIPQKNIYNYQNFDSIAQNKDIDIIYVVLPNGMHKEFVIRAAKAGKHVICEKPMANNLDECMEMIQACNKAGVRLSLGYRLHFEPHHRHVMKLGQQKVYGDVHSIDTSFSFRMRKKGQWRLDKELSGGGALMDIGIYCVQGAIYTIGALPLAVKASMYSEDKNLFDEVEEFIDWELTFPGNIKAKCHANYSNSTNFLKIKTEKGYINLEPSYGYGGIKGETHEGAMGIKNVNQQALQMDDFAVCIQENKPSRIPGVMGGRDMAILDTIYKAARSGKEEKIEYPDQLRILDKV
mgnify:CR=1 FL=1